MGGNSLRRFFSHLGRRTGLVWLLIDCSSNPYGPTAKSRNSNLKLKDYFRGNKNERNFESSFPSISRKSEKTLFMQWKVLSLFVETRKFIFCPLCGWSFFILNLGSAFNLLTSKKRFQEQKTTDPKIFKPWLLIPKILRQNFWKPNF